MDAIIVRLMKSRNAMMHNDLLMDVKKQYQTQSGNALNSN
jgi:hypothetical protein